MCYTLFSCTTGNTVNMLHTYTHITAQFLCHSVFLTRPRKCNFHMLPNSGEATLIRSHFWRKKKETVLHKDMIQSHANTHSHSLAFSKHFIPQSILVHTLDGTPFILTLIHSWVISLRQPCFFFRRWEETRQPGGNPDENRKLYGELNPSSGSNQGRFPYANKCLCKCHLNFTELEQFV